MSKHIEVEGGEIAIQNEAGDIAIIPIKDVEKVKGMMNDPKAIDDYVSNLPKMADYAEDGSLVYQMWEEKTGTPWKTAHSQGLTSGSYDDNMRLRKDLLAGKYDKNVSTTAQPTKTDISFSEAFAKARQEQGAEGKFEWNGKMYGTKYKSEVEPKKKDTSSYAEKVRNSRQGTRKNKDGSESTVLMTSSDNYAYPTLFQDNDGKWVELNDKDNWAARKEAEKRGELYEFDSPGEAALFAEGAWKKGTSQNTFKSPGEAGASAQAGANKGQQDLTGLLGNALKGSVNLPEGKKMEEEPWYKGVADSFIKDVDNFKKGMQGIKKGIDVVAQTEADILEHGSSWVKKKLMESTDLVKAKDDVIEEEKVAPITTPVERKEPAKNFKDVFTEQAGYQKLGDAKSWKTGYNVHSYSNAFDNDEGYDYTPIPNAGSHVDSTYSSPGVAHFLLDADVSGDKPYTHEYSQNYIKQQLAGQNIQGGSTVENQYFPVISKKDSGKVNVKYKTKDELKRDDIKNISAPLRQYKYTDIDWGGKPVPHPGFNSSVVSVPVKKEWTDQDGSKTNHSHFIYAKASGDKSYGDFSGAGVVFIVNKGDKRMVVDYSGSVNNIKNKGQSLINKYNLKPEDLVIGFHDLGSFNAKPAGDNNQLKYSPKKFNPKPWTGGALAF
jgi:hypothetical protein